MKTNIEKAKALLRGGGYTCVLCRAETVYTSRRRGVRPLLDLLDENKDCRGFAAADRVVGAGAAQLYALLGVREVFAEVISEAGLAILRTHGVAVESETIAPYIVNRAGDGVCPIERAVQGIGDPHAALEEIRKTLSLLRKGE